MDTNRGGKILCKDAIDPEILPLVEAINGTGLFSTFASCGGHFDKANKYDPFNGTGYDEDRKYPYVRFRPVSGIPHAEEEEFLALLTKARGGVSLNENAEKTQVNVYTGRNPADLGGPYHILEFHPYAPCSDTREALNNSIAFVAQVIRDRTLPADCRASGRVDVINVLISSIPEYPSESCGDSAKADELLTMYKAKLEGIASKYLPGGLDWLKENRSWLYTTIEKAENSLNKVWGQCLAGRLTINNFKDALWQWHNYQMSGIKAYNQTKTG